MDDDDIIFSSYGGNRWILTGGTTLPPPQSVENIRDPPPQDAKKHGPKMALSSLQVGLTLGWSLVVFALSLFKEKTSWP